MNSQKSVPPYEYGPLKLCILQNIFLEIFATPQSHLPYLTGHSIMAVEFLGNLDNYHSSSSIIWENMGHSLNHKYCNYQKVFQITENLRYIISESYMSTRNAPTLLSSWWPHPIPLQPEGKEISWKLIYEYLKMNYEYWIMNYGYWIYTCTTGFKCFYLPY